MITTDGSPLSWGRALARYVGYIVSAVALSIWFLWIAFDQKRQGWHDKIAGTCVAFVDDEVIDPENVKDEKATLRHTTSGTRASEHSLALVSSP